MKCLLLPLALGLALLCGVQGLGVPRPMGNLDVQKVAGTWYSVAAGANDFALRTSRDAPLRLFVRELRPTPQGDVEILVHRWEDEQCVEEKVLAQKTESAGKFTIDYLREDRLLVLDTDYKNFLFFCVEKAAAPARSRACQYLARTPEGNELDRQQFDRTLKLLSIHIHIVLTRPRAEEKCRV